MTGAFLDQDQPVDMPHLSAHESNERVTATPLRTGDRGLRRPQREPHRRAGRAGRADRSCVSAEERTSAPIIRSVLRAGCQDGRVIVRHPNFPQGAVVRFNPGTQLGSLDLSGQLGVILWCLDSSPGGDADPSYEVLVSHLGMNAAYDDNLFAPSSLVLSDDATSRAEAEALRLFGRS